MSDVFLSYSRKDIKFVREIFELLGARKREAWIDLHKPTTTPIPTSTPLSLWTPIATPTQGNATP